MGDHSTQFLSWFWSNCVGLIVAEPKGLSEVREVPQIWWIGTGIVSSTPFHAAGNHYTDSVESALNQPIFSYTPTIKALTYSGLAASTRARLSGKETSVLLVAMPDTAGKMSLPGVSQEVLAIQEAVGSTYSIEVRKHPTTEQVLVELKRYDIVHFACHGSSDRRDPSNSHLLFQKKDISGLSVDKLSVSKISNEQTLGRAWVAFLSVCSTVDAKVEHFADEDPHISGAFQIDGFAHVIRNSLVGGR